MGLAKISKLPASKHCKGIDGRVGAFSEVPMEGDWPYLRPDATYLKPRESGSIISVAGTVAVAVNSNGRPEIIGLKVGPSEAEAVWSCFLNRLLLRGERRDPSRFQCQASETPLPGLRRGGRQVRTPASLKQKITRFLDATWQRCQLRLDKISITIHTNKVRQLC